MNVYLWMQVLHARLFMRQMLIFSSRSLFIDNKKPSNFSGQVGNFFKLYTKFAAHVMCKIRNILLQYDNYIAVMK